VYHYRQELESGSLQVLAPAHAFRWTIGLGSDQAHRLSPPARLGMATGGPFRGGRFRRTTQGESGVVRVVSEATACRTLVVRSTHWGLTFALSSRSPEHGRVGCRGAHMDSKSAGVFDDVVVTSTVRLFESLASEVTYAGQQVAGGIPPIDDAVVSILGFAGERMRGALTLVCHPRVVGHSLPGIRRPSDRPEALIRDWSGELVNRLLGRIKNQLVRRGLDFRVAIPISVRAEALRVPPLDVSSGPWHQFVSDFGAIWVRLDLQSEHPVFLPSLIPMHHEVPEEGDLMLF